MNLQILLIFILLTIVACSSNDKPVWSDEDELIDMNSGKNASGQQVVGPIIEATSLLGDALVRPEFDIETQERLMGDLRKAIEDFNVDPNNPESIIWVARRTAYLWRYQDAIYILTDGLRDFPDDPRFFRHRGHRYITVRKFDEAIEDLLKARDLIAGTSDEIEPDGAPNEHNIPVSTLHFNIHYHLGVAYYLKGHYDFALESFIKAYEVSLNNDTKISASDWIYMSYMRMGRQDQAITFINTIDTNIEVLESHSYLNRIRLYKGEVSPEELLGESTNTLNLITQGYGVARWYIDRGQYDTGHEILKDVLETNYWAAFGYIAAEAALSMEY